MKLPELRGARYKGRDFEIKLINPVFEEKDGIIYVSCILEANEGKEEYERLKRILFDEGDGIIHTKESCGKIVKCDAYLNNIHTNYNDIKAQFICSHRIESTQEHFTIDAANDERILLQCFSVEGFKALYDQTTTISAKRVVNNKEENFPIEWRRDYTEVDVRFYHNKKFYNIKFSIIEIPDNNLVSFRIVNGAEIEKGIYFELKPKLVSFLSLLGSNRINIREEYFVSKKHKINYIYSVEKSEKKNNFEYYPISNTVFACKHVIHDFFKCFNRFKEIDDKLDLGHIISLLNETNNLYIDTKCFILFVALEKLCSKFMNSDLCLESDVYIIDDEDFNTRMENVKKQFKEEFKGVRKQLSRNLYSKLCDINKKSKYNKKIDALLDYAEINKTDDIDDVVLRIRNLAVHEGKINYQSDGKAYKNYEVLDNLIRDILSNLIYYKGIRYYGRENGKLIVDQKTKFKTEEEITYPPDIPYGIDYVPNRLATLWFRHAAINKSVTEVT